MDILITEDLQSPELDRLAERHSLVREPNLFREPDQLRAALAQARAVMVRNQTQLTGDVLRFAQNLVAIGRLGVGLDNIDVNAASELGIVVIAPLNANAVTVAELTLGLMLSLARRLPHADRDTKAGGWNRAAFTGIELDGRTLALCGFGRIGRQVAARARAFGMRVVVYDPFLKPGDPGLAAAHVSQCSKLDDALSNADFVSLHLPLTADNQRMFGVPQFSSMKRGAYFLNTSRGGLVNESALVDALESGHLAGAALDVRASEPPKERGRLEAMDNVILLPHIGAFTVEAQARMFKAVCADVDRVLTGGAAENFVNFAGARR